MNAVMERVRLGKIIAIVRGLDGRHMLGLASALYEGGITMMEVTFDQRDPARWADTCGAVRLIAERFGDRLLVGAGTVLSLAQLEMAHSAGARYMVAPDVNPEVIRAAKQLGMGAFPGALTPTECVTAYAAGADAVKVFPAGNFGPEYIRAIRAPLSHIPMLAVGGITVENARGFIDAGCVGLGIGGRLVNSEWIENGEFDRITALAREYVKAVE